MTVGMGIDIGREHDKTVIVLAEEKDGLVFVRRVRVLDGVPFAQQQAVMKDESQKYAPDLVAVDATGIGMETAERLRFELGATVIPYKFTEESKSELMGVAYDFFTSGKVRVPAKYRPVLEEFANIRKEITAAGNVVYRDEPHGDISWATALAFYAIRATYGGGQVIDASSMWTGYLDRRIPDIFKKPEDRNPKPTDVKMGASPEGTYLIKLPILKCDKCERVFTEQAHLDHHKAIDHPETA